MHVSHHQVDKYGYRKVLQKGLPLHNQSAKNTLNIIPKKGVVKGTIKTRKSIKFSIKFVPKSQMS
jgi:hypothetical protein